MEPLSTVYPQKLHQQSDSIGMRCKRDELQAFVLTVMKNLFLGTNAKGHSCCCLKGLMLRMKQVVNLNLEDKVPVKGGGLDKPLRSRRVSVKNPKYCD